MPSLTTIRRVVLDRIKSIVLCVEEQGVWVKLNNLRWLFWHRKYGIGDQQSLRSLVEECHFLKPPRPKLNRTEHRVVKLVGKRGFTAVRGEYLSAF